MPKPDALVVHAMPGRVRFRVPGKKGDRSYFEELLAAISKCSGLEKMVINPATASVLINFDADHTDELNGFLEKNNFFQVVDQAKKQPAVKGAGDNEAGQGGRKKEGKTETTREIPRLVGAGLIGWSCYRLMRDGFVSPPWHAALWYGYTLLSNSKQEKQDKTSIVDAR
ncbi:MAG: hypothetical protein HY789_05145 [Deltaproteobacteria bacterium]|nr:hypothetical protein [Deltaproteobacteria bacterium]